jgi:bifunctional UDP-N-acetylglucosamine pyrophosphorylase/glucosamine-1-phosphate N-acetyltransferase
MTSNAEHLRGLRDNSDSVRKSLEEQGVFFMDAASAWIDAEATIGAGTVIYPGVIIEGECEIGENCALGPNARIVGSRVESGASISYSVVLESRVGADTAVGPFAYVRPGSDIGSHCKIGDFVEIKNSTVGNGTKASHLTYVGDSVVGDNVNFGCGTVTVNYDGKNKHKTIIGDNAFIGCNTNLVAPVTVADGAYTAAGSTITDDVPPNSLAIARARQVNKVGWRRPGRARDQSRIES